MTFSHFNLHSPLVTRGVTFTMNVLSEYGGWFILAGVLLTIYIVSYILWLRIQNKRIRQMTQTGVLLEVVLEKDTESEHLGVEQMWSSFHSGLYIPWHRRPFKAQPYITFEIKSEHTAAKSKKEITFNFWVPEEYKSMIKQRILSLYPKAQIHQLKEDYIPTTDDRMRVIETAELGLKEDSAFSIQLFKDFKADPLSSITAAMTELENKEIAVVQILARPMSPSWRVRAEKTLLRYERNGKKPSKLPEWAIGIGSFFGLFFVMLDSMIQTIFGSTAPAEVEKKGSKMDSDNQSQMLEKIKRNPFAFEVRVLVGSPMGQDAAKEKIRNIVAAFKEMDGAHNGFQRNHILNKEKSYRNMQGRFLSIIDNNDVLTSVELAGFAHLPNKQNFTPGLKKIQSKRTEVPSDAASDDAFAVAMDMHGNERPIGLDLDGRMRHIYVSGMTGVGKFGKICRP